MSIESRPLLHTQSRSLTCCWVACSRINLREKEMFTINAEVRKEQGKGASRRLRAANKFPAIIYGGKEAPLAVELDHDKVMNMQVKAEFYSEVLTIVVDGKEIKVKAQDVQRHPYKPKLLHIDFVRA
ncbi:rplY [Escherichia coli O25b:H4]|nr:50S ribosomal protein L25 [Escherichia coli CFT073]ABE07930.1 50S ribosomal protein L25 [Escherichia coli UTI89]ADN47029.1 50S ribosomal subunit protein L25 [Escherichia coli ABU 83972]ANK02428.1 rplY [Escherichia coli O25b:H4]CDN82864.1 50S ribosomal protein L25 [Escherichia coli O25b:H4-ST131]